MFEVEIIHLSRVVVVVLNFFLWCAD